MFSYLGSSMSQERGQGCPRQLSLKTWQLPFPNPPSLRRLGLVSPKSDEEEMTVRDWEGGSEWVAQGGKCPCSLEAALEKHHLGAVPTMVTLGLETLGMGLPHLC